MPAPKPIVAGVAGARPQPLAYHWSRTSGNQWTLTWRGLPKDVVGVPVSGASEIDYQQDAGGPLATLKATFQSPSFVPGGGVEVSQDTLELTFARQSLLIFKNKTFSPLSDGEVALVYSLVQAVKDAITAAINSKQPVDVDAEIVDAEFNAGITDITKPPGQLIDKAIALLLRGTDNYNFFQPILTLTRTVSPQFPSTLSTGSVSKVFTSAAVATYLNASAVLLSLANVIGNIGQPPGTVLGWLKDARLQWTAMGSCQMIETFEYGAWETDLYDLA